MLTLFGRSAKYCDGISRRSFLKIGGFTMGAGGGLSLADLLRAEAAAGTQSSTKSVINVFLAGGPPHQDLWDIKTEAPVDIRGEFKPIATTVPGIDICELFPGIASHMEKLSVIRSVVGSSGRHDAYQCMTGWAREDLAASGGHPSVGSVVTKFQGPADRAVPPFVGLAARTRERRWSDSGSPGFLGSAYAAFKPYEVDNSSADRRDKLVDVYEQGPGMANLTLGDITLDRLGDRNSCSGASTAYAGLPIATAWQRPWTPSTRPPSTCSPPRSPSMRWTFRRKTREPSSGMAPAVPTSFSPTAPPRSTNPCCWPDD